MTGAEVVQCVQSVCWCVFGSVCAWGFFAVGCEAVRDAKAAERGE